MKSGLKTAWIAGKTLERITPRIQHPVNYFSPCFLTEHQHFSSSDIQMWCILSACPGSPWIHIIFLHPQHFWQNTSTSLLFSACSKNSSWQTALWSLTTEIPSVFDSSKHPMTLVHSSQLRQLLCQSWVPGCSVSSHMESSTTFLRRRNHKHCWSWGAGELADWRKHSIISAIS